MSDTKRILEKINAYSCEPQRKLLLCNMDFNRKYDIFSAHRHRKIKSGKTVIKLYLNNCYIYLPDRFNILPDHFLNAINENKEYKIQNCGRWRKTFKIIFSNSETEGQEIDNNINYLNIQEFLDEFL